MRSRGRCFARLQTKRKPLGPVALGARPPPLNRIGGAVALVLHVRLNPAESPRETPVTDVLSPSLRAHIGDFGSAAATKCVNPATMDPLSDLAKNKIKTPWLDHTHKTYWRRRGAGTARTPIPCAVSTQNANSKAPDS